MLHLKHILLLGSFIFAGVFYKVSRDDYLGMHFVLIEKMIGITIVLSRAYLYAEGEGVIERAQARAFTSSSIFSSFPPLLDKNLNRTGK